ncbi:MAG: XRE family transcriptional regulator [Paracoccaceae bacterium]
MALDWSVLKNINEISALKSLPPHIPIVVIAISKKCSACCVTSERTEMKKKPHAETELAKFVERRVLELRPKKSQSDIATEAGYVNPNMITMIKQGATKVALDRVPALAEALESDAAYVMRLALEQAIGKTAANAVIEVFGEPVTANEVGWLRAIRDASGNADPRMTGRAQAAIRAIFGK